MFQWIDFDGALFSLFKSMGIDLSLFDFANASFEEYYLLSFLLFFIFAFLMYFMKLFFNTFGVAKRSALY